MPRIGALILAAGGSTRMGSPKQLLRLDGESLVQRAARVAIEAGCSPVRVVVGASSQTVRRELDGFVVQIIENPDWASGMGSSIRAGMADADYSIDAMMILLCDQPLISAEHLEKLIATYESSGNPIAACAYSDGTLGPPALFAKEFFAKLRSLNGESGAKKILMQHADQVAKVSIPENCIDLDTPDDVTQLNEHRSHKLREDHDD